MRALEIIDEVFRENQWEDLLCHFWSATGKVRRRSYRWVRAAQHRPPSGAEKWPELSRTVVPRNRIRPCENTALSGLFRFSSKWRERSSVKITERTHEEATDALHTGRESQGPPCLLGVQEVPSSNLGGPTKTLQTLKAETFLDSCVLASTWSPKWMPGGNCSPHPFRRWRPLVLNKTRQTRHLALKQLIPQPKSMSGFSEKPDIHPTFLAGNPTDPLGLWLPRISREYRKEFRMSAIRLPEYVGLRVQP